MKNTQKILKKGCIILIVGMLLILLSGCNTLTFKKKYTKEEDSMAATSTIKVTFKDDIAEEITLILKFETIEDAEKYYDNYKKFNELLQENQMDIELNRKVLTIKMAANKYIDSDQKLTKEVVEEYFKNEEYN